ncbi:MAG: TIGR02452 family protein, partial [Chloroflexota bacterium]
VIEVTAETTQVAAHRLVVEEGCDNVILLSYASARNPGGGFINGAKAQEEDLSRCSGLYPCLLTQPTYYEVNRTQKSLLYTDHIIYSPNVPWFRTKSRNLLDEVFLASVITAPAPNAGQHLRRNPNDWPSIERALRRRAGMVLAIAKDQGHRILLLGAWGCGVFRNDPAMVADAFGHWLTQPIFSRCFDRVVFAVYDPGREKKTLQAFQTRFQ